MWGNSGHFAGHNGHLDRHCPISITSNESHVDVNWHIFMHIHLCNPNIQHSHSLYTHMKNSYNSHKFHTPQVFEYKVLDHGSTKQTSVTALVTAPGKNGGICCRTSLNKALDGSTSRKRLSDTVCHKSDWPALPTDRHSPAHPYSLLADQSHGVLVLI
jgi:hypothetical protein